MLAVVAYTTSAYALGAAVAPVRAARTPTRQGAVTMDETLLERALEGTLEEEGAENVFMSEVGWATYLDKECGSSYNMNQRVSQAEDGYFTPDIFSNPLDIASAFFEGVKTTFSAPLNTHFMTISNDQTGNRAWPKGYASICSQTRRPIRAVHRPLSLSPSLGTAAEACGSSSGPAGTRASPRSCAPRDDGLRSLPPRRRFNEIKSRTIAPKFKDFDKKLRITGIPGFNFFGTPSSKQDTGPLEL